MKNNIIIDNRYLTDRKNIDIAINYLKSTDFSKLQDGRLTITDTIWANLQTYITKEDALFEVHKKYIDIQYVISGAENIMLTDYYNCKIEIPYNDDNDIEFLSCEKHIKVEMIYGDYLIIYPNNAHKPAISISNPSEVRKLVIKIPVEK